MMDNPSQVGHLEMELRIHDYRYQIHHWLRVWHRIHYCIVIDDNMDVVLGQLKGIAWCIDDRDK